MYTLATLYQFKRHLGIPPDNTAQDDRLLTALGAAVQHMERETGRRYLPYVASYAQDVNPRRPSELVLTHDLLQLESVADVGGTLDADDVLLLPPGGPASVLSLNGVFLWDGGPERAVTVSGVWGWHDDPLHMWQATGDTLDQTILNTNDTQMTVQDADATYADGQTPRFSVGSLLEMSGEYLRVLAVDTAANVLTVERGAQGTTAFTHLQGTPIDVFRPPYDVLMTALEVAAWFYRQPDSATPSDVPPAVVGAMHSLRRAVVRA